MLHYTRHKVLANKNTKRRGGFQSVLPLPSRVRGGDVSRDDRLHERQVEISRQLVGVMIVLVWGHSSKSEFHGATSGSPRRLRVERDMNIDDLVESKDHRLSLGWTKPSSPLRDVSIFLSPSQKSRVNCWGASSERNKSRGIEQGRRGCRKCNRGSNSTERIRRCRNVERVTAHLLDRRSASTHVGAGPAFARLSTLPSDLTILNSFSKVPLNARSVDIFVLHN